MTYKTIEVRTMKADRGKKIRNKQTGQFFDEVFLSLDDRPERYEEVEYSEYERWLFENATDE